MLHKDFNVVAETIINQMIEIQQRRAKAAVDSGRLASVEDYQDSEDPGYEESVAPLRSALKVLREGFFGAGIF